MRPIKCIFLLFLLLSACQNNKDRSNEKDVQTYPEQSGDTTDRVTEKHELPRSEIVVFVLHRFNDRRFPSTSISTQKLEQIFKYLKSENIEVVSAAKAVELTYHKNKGNKRRVVFTVDDGYQSFYTDGFPVFQKYNIPVTLFINTESVGWPDYLDWQQLKELAVKGVEIGNHSHSHAHFLNHSNDTRDFFKKDLLKAHDLLSEQLTFENIYAYPYGEHLKPFHKWLEDEGYKAAFSQQSGVFHELSDPYCIPRFPLNDGLAELSAVKEKVNMNAMRTDMKCQVGLQESNKPVLEVMIKEKDLQLDQLQCFTGGDRCAIKTDSNKVVLQANVPLSGRRNKYTLTAPDQEGQWHWFSYVFVNTDVPEN